MKRLLIAAAAVFAFASTAQACLTCERYPVFHAQHQAPPPTQAQEAQVRLSEHGCGMAADMALVARSLAVEKVAQPLAARLMALIYGELSGGAVIEQLRERILLLAFARTEKPADLARMVGQACLRTGGDPDSMLGPRTHWRPRPPAARGLRV